MTVKYKGEDTKNKFELVEGWHDAADKEQEPPASKHSEGDNY